MSTLSLTRDKIYKTVARQLHGVVPCWVCGVHVSPTDATLEHIKPRSEGGSSHQDNLAISHDFCNNQRHIQGTTADSKRPVTGLRSTSNQVPAATAAPQACPPGQTDARPGAAGCRS